MSTRTTVAAFESGFYRIKRVGEVAIVQVSDIGLHEQINPHQISIAVIVQHLHGNMLSRFTDFLHSDGEKPTRDREAEFVDRDLPRDELLRLWDAGWDCVFNALCVLNDDDLWRIVTIRTEPQTVAHAIGRQLAHYAWHVGHIALIGKHLLGERWRYLTIAPGFSDAFNERMGMRKLE